MTTSTADAGQGDEPENGGVWPPADYGRHIQRLRAAIGETLYIAELRETDATLGAQVTDRPYVLLDVIDFPRPDPARGLAPHLVLLDDGRGVNLGRVARISRRPFAPAPQDVLYLDREANRTLLFGQRRLSPAFIAERSKTVLGQVLGHGDAGSPARIASASGDDSVSAESSGQ